MDFLGFYTGQIFDAYEWLGCHYDGKQAVFRTFAPQAQKVELLINGSVLEMNDIGMMFFGDFQSIPHDIRPEPVIGIQEHDVCSFGGANSGQSGGIAAFVPFVGHDPDSGISFGILLQDSGRIVR